MEHVTVIFPTLRRVFIDGQDCGQTGEILRVAAGTHLFNLGEPSDYDPDAIMRQIAGTDPLLPQQIVFTPKA
jgi:hypothetical protein